jgi:hypothetical protein
MQRVAIHSVPRSGSTWVGSIFDSHPQVAYRFQPLFSYAFKGVLKSTSTTEEIISFFNSIAASPDDFINQAEAKAKGLVPVFKKDLPTVTVYKEVRYHHIIENLLQRDTEIRVIGLVRNPLSTLYSWYNAPREFKTELGWQLLDEWQYAEKKNQGKEEEFNGYEKWKQVAYCFRKLAVQYPDRFYLLRYQDLLSDTERVVKSLFEFTGLDFARQTQDFILLSRQSHVDDAYGVFKNKLLDNEWQAKIPQPIVDYVVNDLADTELVSYLD